MKWNWSPNNGYAMMLKIHEAPGTIWITDNTDGQDIPCLLKRLKINEGESKNWTQQTYTTCTNIWSSIMGGGVDFRIPLIQSYVCSKFITIKLHTYKRAAPRHEV